jgi:5-keto-L-gluconate epimerase
MKLSTAVSTPDARFSALAIKGDFETTFSFARRHGLDGIEIHIRDPKTVSATQLAALMKRHSLEVPAVGTGRAFGEDGLSFSDPDAAVRRAAVQRIKQHIDLASRLGALVIIGLIVGKSQRTELSEAQAAACMKKCAEHAAAKNVTLVVEPINRYETGFIITADDCLRFLDTVGMPNCKVLLDTFHMNIEEADIHATIEKVGGRIGHVHVADSNRRHPGAGHLDFKKIIASLRRAGYDGYLSAEMFPDPDPDTSVAAMASILKKIIGKTSG